MRKGLWVILLTLLWTAAAAQERWCPEPTNRLVNDYSGKLTADEAQRLEARLVAFDDSTSNQILVVILPELHDCEIMDLGTRIGTTWGVGQKEWKNGLVILIKSRDMSDEDDYGDVAIVTGYGLEGALPDLFCKRIIDDKMLEPLGEGDYYEAISAALDIIEPVCRGEYCYDRYQQDNLREALLGFGAIILLIVIAVLIVNRYNKKHPGGGGGSGGSGDYSRHDGPAYWGGVTGSGLGSGGFGGFGGSSGGFGGFGGGSFGGGGAHGRF